LTWVTLRMLWEDLDELTDAVVDETLRLHPPAVGALRRLTAPRTVAGHELAAGTLTMVPAPLMHRDPRRWDDPDAFRPERHSGHAVASDAFMPFGGGARRCLAEPLARTEIAAVIPEILRRPLRAARRWPERMVLRGTILVPQRSGLVYSASSALA
jgi:cytochrome P450